MRLWEAVRQVLTFLGQYLPQFFTALRAPIGIFVVIAFLDLPVAAVFLGFALGTLVMPALFHRLNAKSSLRRRDAYGAFAADFLDSIQGLATLTAFGQSKRRGDALAKRADEVFRSPMSVLARTAAPRGAPAAAVPAPYRPRARTTPAGWPMRNAPPLDNSAARPPLKRWARVPGIIAAEVRATVTVTLMALWARSSEITRAQMSISPGPRGAPS